MEPALPPGITDRVILDHVDVGLAMVRDGRLIHANEGLARMTGGTREALPGHNLADLFEEGDQAAVHACLNDPRTCTTQTCGGGSDSGPATFRLCRGDGRAPMHVWLRAVPLTRGTDGAAPLPRDTSEAGDILLVTFIEATQAVEMKRALWDSETRYRGLFENALEGIYQTTPEGYYVTANPALARIYGFDSPEELIATRKDIARQTYVDPKARQRFVALMESAGVVENFEAQIHRRDGSAIWITENARCVRDPDGTVRFYEGTVQDITERRQANADLRLMAKVLNSVHEGIVIIDRDGLVWGANEAYQRMTGHDAADLLGRPARLTTPELHEPNFEDTVLAHVDQHGLWIGEAWAPRRDAAPFPMEMSVTGVRDRTGALTHYVAACTDITKRKRDEEHIRFQANYDMLTHLPNRYLIMDRLEQAILKAQRDGSRVCVLFLDLDRFKNINDSYGHAAGDEVLKLVARRLRQVVRMSDTVGRLAGDEFIIVLTEVSDGDVGGQVAEKITEVLSEAFQVLDAELFCLPSIGITYYPDQAETVETLLRNADIAMYHAKHSGNDRYMTFSSDMAQRSVELMNLETDLRHAVNREELELHYQPKVGADGRTVVGCEALIRWRHPRLGLVSPGDFIPLAEESGLIVPIGRWTLAEACRQYMEWRKHGIAPPSISVNVSVRQFNDSQFLDNVRDVLDGTGMPAGCLDLEITESVMMGDVERAVATLNALKGMGVTLSIDDFGTGYSSLNYLKTFPIDTLKIDQTFVRDVEYDTKDAAIIATIVSLAKNLGFQVVAEGVESREQMDFLRRSDCSLFQGFWVSRPLPANDFKIFLKDSTAEPLTDGPDG
jgi:diguanylate cyclase (GGDEF)-like protein/PAS domain S-box-containing protein